MELKEVYKHTELGLIPIDWDFDLLDAHSKRGSGHTPNKKNREYYDGSIVWVSLADSNKLDRGTISSSVITISDKGILNSSAVLHKKGVVLMSRDAGIGKSAIADCDLCVSQHFITWQCDEKTLHNWYLYYWLQYRKAEFERIASGSTIKTIGLPYFRNYQLFLPKYPEQIDIAKSLQKIDVLIDNLEKLIDKKLLLREALLQKMLKPKKDWQFIKLKEIGKIYGGLSGKSKGDFSNGQYPYIPFMNIMKNPVVDLDNLDFVTIKKGESQNRVSKGDLFFNGSSETPEEVGMCSVLLEDISDLYLNSFCFGLRLNKELKINGLYLSYFFRSSEGRKLFYTMAQGATRYNLSKGNFNKLEIALPSIQEQDEIAFLVTDVDAEINALETKLAKYHNIKQAMMQNLLTGKIRLV